MQFPTSLDNFKKPIFWFGIGLGIAAFGALGGLALGDSYRSENPLAYLALTVTAIGVAIGWIGGIWFIVLIFKKH